MISADAPLLRIPVQMETVQAGFLDAIRLSAEIGGLAYARLSHCLEIVGLRNEGLLPIPGEVAGLFLDAWSVVDAVHRIRELLLQMRGVKRSMPAWQLFIRETEDVNSLRNTVQHLSNEIAEMTRNGWSTWGRLGWLQLMNSEMTRCRSFCLSPGKVITHTQPALNPCGKQFYGRVDHVHLYSKGDCLDLSLAVRRTSAMIELIERNLSTKFPNPEHSGSDTLVFLEVEMVATPRADGHAEGGAPEPASDAE